MHRKRTSDASSAGAEGVKDIIKSDDESVLTDIITNDSIRHISVIFKRVLDEREQQVISMRYGLYGNHPMPQRDIAAILGISRSYVSRIGKKALLKLRDALNG